MRISDWSSDVCSSDLLGRPARYPPRRGGGASGLQGLLRSRRTAEDRKSVVYGKSVSVRVDLGGRRVIKKKEKRVEHGRPLITKINTNLNSTEIANNDR